MSENPADDDLKSVTWSHQKLKRARTQGCAEMFKGAVLKVKKRGIQNQAE